MLNSGRWNWRYVFATGFLLALLAAMAPAKAQGDYPNRPITLVIPLPPGGTNDMMARAVADKLSASLGQQDRKSTRLNSSH